MTTSPIPEVRAMVAAARQFVDGEIDFLALRGAVLECRISTRIHGADSKIERLASEWAQLIERTWNEWGISSDPLQVDQLRTRIAEDLDDL